MALPCSFCCYRSSARLDLIKHSFASHSVEPTFQLVCGIHDCLHCFKSGATFQSFKTHAQRKHPFWKDIINDGGPTDLMNLSSEISHFQSSAEVVDQRSALTSACVPSSGTVTLFDRTPASMDVQKILSPEHTAALFLRTFKEQYRLSQKAIDYAVGAVNTIVDSVCASVQETLQQSLVTTSAELEACFDHGDPFSELQTEYQQTRFYRQHFGLVVSTD